MNDVDVLVVGGGPAGATAAAKLARAGLEVLVLEAGAHPRAHVGESLLPGIIPILDDIGALAAIEDAGFARKSGSTLWNWGRTPAWDLWFADSDAYDHAWLVERARFDAILFAHAGACGATLREHAVVRELVWEHGRVVGARWQAQGGAPTTTRARWVIDATGQSALQGRALALRQPIEALRHQAMWAHFDGVARLPLPRAEQALFVAEPTQWWWLFPLAAGRTSIGVVQLDAADRRGPVRPDFDGELARCAALAPLVSPHGRRVTEIRHERDWSYRMGEVAGAGWLAVGDAAGFIDPVLSTGVMLALHSAWHAATVVIEQLAGAGDEAGALVRYREHHLRLFDDLLRMVRYYYQQNLHREDYFWESKRILLQQHGELKPLKAFMLLTSGLVQNLALDDLTARGRTRREQLADETTAALDDAPERLGFLCLHLHRGEARVDGPDRGTSLFVVIEPRDAAAPTLFRTRNFHVNAIAPRHGNDPISVPELAAPLRRVAAWIDALDADDGDSLAAFWRRRRGELAARLDREPLDGFVLARAFGE